MKVTRSRTIYAPRGLIGMLAVAALVGAFRISNSSPTESAKSEKRTHATSQHVGTVTSSSLPSLRYNVTDLGTLGGPSSEAVAVNSAGKIVGRSEISDRRGFYHAFLYSRGKMIDLGTLGGHSQSEATGINNRGVIVGTSESFYGDLVSSYTFIYRDGQMSLLELDQKGLGSMLAAGINDAGHYTGICRGPHACLYDGKNHDLGTLPGGSRSEGLGINNQDEVVGVSWISNEGDTRAFLWHKGSMSDLGTLPGHYRSQAHGINNTGQIVGWSAPPYKVAPDPRAFLYSQGSMRNLNEVIPSGCGWVLLKANGINDAGQIVGEGVYKGKHHAVLLVPAVRR